MKDVEIMFENAKMYNRDDSQIYKDAVDLQVRIRCSFGFGYLRFNIVLI
jgi:Bromodomain